MLAMSVSLAELDVEGPIIWPVSYLCTGGQLKIARLTIDPVNRIGGEIIFVPFENMAQHDGSIFDSDISLLVQKLLGFCRQLFFEGIWIKEFCR